MKLKDLSTGVSDLLKMDPKILQVEPGFNVRFDCPELEVANAELRESIRATGVLKPFTIRLKDDQAFIVDGHRRHAAVMALIAEGVEIPAVPCMPEPRGVSDADRVSMLITTNSGLPLSPLEKGEVFKRLMGFGWSLDQIAAKVGIGPKQVGNLVDLAGATTQIKELVSTGQVSGTTALKEIKASGAAAGPRLVAAVQQAKAEGKTKATAKTIKAATKAATKAAPPTAAPQVELELDASSDRPRVNNTPGKFKEACDTLWEILNTDSLGTAQIMVRDFFNVKKAA